MDSGQVFQTSLSLGGELSFAPKRSMLLRLIRAAQPITRTDIADRLKIDKSTVTEVVRPLIDRGILREEVLETGTPGRRPRALTFGAENDYFVGVNLGVRHTQVGVTSLSGDVSHDDEFETPKDASRALQIVRGKISEIVRDRPGKTLRMVGVSVPGMADATRRELIYAPNLDWRNVAISENIKQVTEAPIVVENDSTAAAMYEARMKVSETDDASASNFVLVRSGTGIGVGLVIGGEVYRGTGAGRGIAGEFGHMTIVAGGKPCVCGNRGCWERYASAASAAALYLGDRPIRPGETLPRFVEIVAKAENGDIRSRRTLEKIGDYLGIGIANVIMGTGVPRVIISGRLVYGWDLIVEPLHAAVRRSIVGKVDGWSVEAGSPSGSALGGALEIAVEGFLSTV
ncbi:MAG TPA: ROK family transcriptional regulator [Pyrinomonadaceae bacterium]|nr:ROK family transcriptional regulator [Pyrinomonadaceae bacterium]